jgi:hypothetical protein
MYILCLYKKDVSRGDFGVLQKGPKGVISEIGDAFWSQIYAYILSMGKGCVCVENTSSFFLCRPRPVYGLQLAWEQVAINPRTTRYRADTDAKGLPFGSP